MPERLVRQPADHRVSGHALGPALPAPRVRLQDPALDHRTIRLNPLSDGLEAELVETAERGQVRANEGSVIHVEVLRMGSVRTSILGGPRPLSSDRRAQPDYTLSREEPAMDRSRYNADLENKTYIGKFSQFFNLTISTFFSAHLLLCLGWFFWREEDGGNISIFAPEVSAIGWIVTVLLASISIVDVSVLKTRRDSLYRELGNLNRGIDRRLEYRPLPLFNIINLAAFLSVLIVLVSDSALILTVAPPIRESGLIFTARHMVAALIASYATAYVYFTLTRMKSPQVGGRRIATYSANALYIILALACGALSASSWGSSYAYLIALPVQILTLALVPVLVKRSKVGRQRLHLSNNNFLLERRADLKRAIDRVNDQITEIDPK